MTINDSSFFCVTGREVDIIRGGVPAKMSGSGRLLLSDSRKLLPPLPFGVERVALTWVTDSPVRCVCVCHPHLVQPYPCM